MSWMQKLYETYEQAQNLTHLAQQDQVMPICHSPQNAHIEVVIDGNGQFIRAQVLQKTQIILQATESSASRGNGIAPHGLADKLHYVAGDYEQYKGKNKKKFYFDAYHQQLKSWCTSPYSLPSLQAVLKYIERNSLIQDLVHYKVLHLTDGALQNSWTSKEEKPELFKALPPTSEQGDALICWIIESPDIRQPKTWLDTQVQTSWANYYLSLNDQQDLCLISGEQVGIALNHPAKLRHSGDKAKLVSSNDSSGLTYRGRFIKAEQAQSIGFDVTQKAHNALAWLLKRQGYRQEDYYFVAWAVSGKEIPPALELDSFFNLDTEIKEDLGSDLGASYAQALKKYMNGYVAEKALSVDESVVMMAIDSATPGRMSILYYQEVFAHDYVAKIEKWHQEFCWWQRQSDKAYRWLPSAPALYRVWDAVYGDKVKSASSLKKHTLQRLIPCIVAGQPLPIDIMHNAVKRATNRVAYKKEDKWLWEQNLGIACALYNGFCQRTHHSNFRKEGYNMALETDYHSRDYLFGRLLAIADNIESYTLSLSNENRATNAERLMQRFADQPSSTWLSIYKALDPYMQRLRSRKPAFLQSRTKLLDEVMNAFLTTDFNSDRKLSGEFLLGFHCQRLQLFTKQSSTETTDIIEG
tara:strand:- start:2295 stop:4208 length:1914 start_codon:yes stop_codon:yes gene_type:complete